jgi:MFS superfamily sulfate permease-like transporter
LIITLRRVRPNWPGFLIAVVVGGLLVATIHLPVATIGTRFGGIPATWPHFSVPHIPLERTRDLFPSSFTIVAQMGLHADGHALQFAENFGEALQLAAASVKGARALEALERSIYEAR